MAVVHENAVFRLKRFGLFASGNIAAALCAVITGLFSGIEAANGAAPRIERGCVDCHIVSSASGNDYRLAAKLREWSTAGVPEDVMVYARRAVGPGVELRGYHPEVYERVREGPIPGICLTCHGVVEDAPDLGRLLHMIKYFRKRDGRPNHFLSIYGGSCAHCHDVDSSTGSVTLRQGREVD